MADYESARLDLADLLGAVENAAPVAAADVVGQYLAEALQATEVAFLIADFSGQALVRLGHAGDRAATRTLGDDTAERVPLAGSPHGRVLVSQRLEVVSCPDGHGGSDGARVFAPVTNRGEAIGVLELRLPRTPDDPTIADVALAAHALAYIVIANRRFTDLFEWGQRSVPVSVAAEIQHRLVPASYTCEAGQFTLAGWLEPAGDNAGDTFDFSLDRHTLHISMTDAMGHDTAAAMLATLLVGALRNARRTGADLAEQARLGSAALIERFTTCEFVTGQVVRIDLDSGTATVVNAGHPLPLRLRAGSVEPIALMADPPFGAVAGYDYRIQRLPLEAGDRLIFLTDGMLERNAADLDLAALIVTCADAHPREAVQHLMAAVLDAADGELRDDATALCLDWHGGPERERASHAGAN